MATARRTGTNEQVATYGAAGQGRTYTDLAVWESATDTDHVATGDAESDVLECYDDSASFDDQVDMAGSTNDSTHFRIIRPASGEGHNGTSEVGFSLFSTAQSAVIRIAETNSQAQDIICKITTSYGGTDTIIVPNASFTHVIGCIVVDGLNSGAGVTQGIRPSTSGEYYIILCLVDNCDGNSYLYSASATAVYVYNSVCVDGGGTAGFIGAAAVRYKNCLAENAGINDWSSGSHADSSNNAASDTTAPGGSSRQSQTFTFVASGSNDWHLATGDTGANDFGTDLSGDANYAFDDDIDSELFDTWDIGFDDNAPGTAGLSDPSPVGQLTQSGGMIGFQWLRGPGEVGELERVVVI